MPKLALLTRNLAYKFAFALGILLSITIFQVMAPNEAYADENQEQVVVSPAQQAVNTALNNATTEVSQAVSATNNATIAIGEAQAELSSAQSATSQISSSISSAQSAVNAVQSAVTTINAVDLTVTPIDQGSATVQNALATVPTAQSAINNIDTTTAQTEITQLVTERSQAATLQAIAQTELTQANVAIDNAQTAVNALQATIGNTVDVLQGVDDAGVLMTLPFSMQMGGTTYNNVYVGSNATITFGVNEGWVYHTTPNAPSVSIAGWDWTTWSTGTGITYSTTANSLDIAWDVRPFPQQDASTQMVQIRFNADVNPSDGAWMANVSAIGPIPNGARFNYRETTNGAITAITDTNPGAGFSGQLSQGAQFTPSVDPNIAPVQAAVDAANATIAQLNASLTPVVSQNAINNSTLSSLQSSINSLNATVNSATSTKTSLQSTLNTQSAALMTAISNNIPTPAPILSSPVVDGTTVTVSPELPSGYTANTWFYQVVTNDPSAENPYEGQTLNTDGAPSSIQLTGLTPGATYTIRVANWSGPVSQYTETTVKVPVAQDSSNVVYVPDFSGSQDAADPGTDTEQPEQDTSQDTEEESPENPGEDPGQEGEDSTQPGEEVTPEQPDSEGPSDNTPPDDDNNDSDNTSNDEEVNNLDDALADGEVTTDEAESIIESILADANGELSDAEKEAVAAVLVAAYVENGEAVPADVMAELGISAADLPPDTPIELSNGVVIVAKIQAAFDVLAAPSELLSAIFENPAQVLTALTNLGADMSEEEREESQKVVVASVIAASIAVQAAAGAAVSAATSAASTTSSSSPSSRSSSRSSGGDAGAPGGREGGTVKRRRTNARKPKKAVKKSGRIRRIKLRRKPK